MLEEDDPASRLSHRREHCLSGARRRQDRRHRGAGSRRHEAGAVRHHLREGQDDAAGSGRQGRFGRHAQARRRRRPSSKAFETVRGRARVKRTMWSRRAQEYEAKINSGDLIAISEVVRDLYRSQAQPEPSYSERQLYEQAIDRMSREVAVVEKISETEAVDQDREGHRGKPEAQARHADRGRGPRRGRLASAASSKRAPTAATSAAVFLSRRCFRMEARPPTRRSAARRMRLPPYLHRRLMAWGARRTT